MLEIIFVILMLASFFGILAMLYKKAGILAELPEQESEDLKIMKRIKNHRYFSVLAPKRVISGVLSKSKSVAKRVEGKASSMLDTLHNQRPENKFSGDYWAKVKRKKK